MIISWVLILTQNQKIKVMFTLILKRPSEMDFTSKCIQITENSPENFFEAHNINPKMLNQPILLLQNELLSEVIKENSLKFPLEI